MIVFGEPPKFDIVLRMLANASGSSFYNTIEAGLRGGKFSERKKQAYSICEYSETNGVTISFDSAC